MMPIAVHVITYTLSTKYVSVSVVSTKRLSLSIDEVRESTWRQSGHRAVMALYISRYGAGPCKALKVLRLYRWQVPQGGSRGNAVQFQGRSLPRAALHAGRA